MYILCWKNYKYQVAHIVVNRSLQRMYFISNQFKVEILVILNFFYLWWWRSKWVQTDVKLKRAVGWNQICTIENVAYVANLKARIQNSFKRRARIKFAHVKCCLWCNFVNSIIQIQNWSILQILKLETKIENIQALNRDQNCTIETCWSCWLQAFADSKHPH